MIARTFSKWQEGIATQLRRQSEANTVARLRAVPCDWPLTFFGRNSQASTKLENWHLTFPVATLMYCSAATVLT